MWRWSSPLVILPANLETDSLVISKGGSFNGNVAKIKDHEAQRGPRPVSMVEEKRASQPTSG